MDLKQLEDWRHFHHSLLCLDLLPYWERCGKDYQYGGFLNCMADTGEPISDDKYVWAQGSGLWAFSHVWAEGYDRNLRLRQFLIKTRDFMLAQGRDRSGKWRYRLGREGQPRQGAISVFSDIFAAMGLVELHRAMDDPEALEVAASTARGVIHRIRQRDFSAVAPYSMRPGTHRQDVLFRTLDLLTQLLPLAGDPYLEAETDRLRVLLTERHADRRRRISIEVLGPDGAPSDEPAGRVFYPAHGIECARVLMEEACRRDKEALLADAIEIMLWHLEAGWDRESGGLFWALHIDRDRPPEDPEWQEKRLLPHVQALHALMLAHEHSGMSWTADWFERVHRYTFDTFRDRIHGDLMRMVDREGHARAEAAVRVKDPFPPLRAVMGVIESIDRQLLALAG